MKYLVIVKVYDTAGDQTNYIKEKVDEIVNYEMKKSDNSKKVVLFDDSYKTLLVNNVDVNFPNNIIEELDKLKEEKGDHFNVFISMLNHTVRNSGVLKESTWEKLDEVFG